MLLEVLDVVTPQTYPHEVMLLGGEPPACLRHGQYDARVPCGEDVLDACVQLALEPRVEIGPAVFVVLAGGEELLHNVVAGGVQR